MEGGEPPDDPRPRLGHLTTDGDHRCGIGLSYSAIAAGLILVYRANGIINFAVVAFGAVALGLFGLLDRARVGFLAVPDRVGAVRRDRRDGPSRY